MRFESRLQAADELARELGGWRGHDPVVLGVPPGGVAMARRIATTLGAQTDLAYVHHLVGAEHPDQAVGSVDVTGRIEVNDLVRRFRISPRELAQEAKFWRQALQRLRRLTAVEPIDLAGRAVIVVDDGATTGATLFGAVHAAYLAGARAVSVAVPVLPAWLVEPLQAEADSVVTLVRSDALASVASHYQRFESLTDADVVAELRAARAEHADRARLRDIAKEDWT